MLSHRCSPPPSQLTVLEQIVLLLSIASPSLRDSPPPTPIGPENLFGHLVYGAAEAPVRHTIARGRILLEDFRHTTLEPLEIARAARLESFGLWERFRELGESSNGVLKI